MHSLGPEHWGGKAPIVSAKITHYFYSAEILPRNTRKLTKIGAVVSIMVNGLWSAPQTHPTCRVVSVVTKFGGIIARIRNFMFLTKYFGTGSRPSWISCENVKFSNKCLRPLRWSKMHKTLHQWVNWWVFRLVVYCGVGVTCWRLVFLKTHGKTCTCVCSETCYMSWCGKMAQ